MRTRLIFFLTTATVLGIGLVAPYRTSLVRLGLLGLWALLAFSILMLIWRRKVLRTLLLVTLAMLALFVVLPGRSATDPVRLGSALSITCRPMTGCDTFTGARIISELIARDWSARPCFAPWLTKLSARLIRPCCGLLLLYGGATPMRSSWAKAAKD